MTDISDDEWEMMLDRISLNENRIKELEKYKMELDSNTEARFKVLEAQVKNLEDLLYTTQLQVSRLQGTATRPIFRGGWH